MPELTRFERTKSTIRYFPPNGTAGLERSCVSGCRRSPLPPASTIASTRRVGAMLGLLGLGIGILAVIGLVDHRGVLSPLFQGRGGEGRPRRLLRLALLGAGPAAQGVQVGLLLVPGGAVELGVVEDEDVALLLDAGGDLGQALRR